MFLFVKIFLLTFSLSLIITPLIKRLAQHFNIVDNPNPPLKDHKQKTAKLGGMAIFLSLLLAISSLFFLGNLQISRVSPNYQYGWGGYYVCSNIFNNKTETTQQNSLAEKSDTNIATSTAIDISQDNCRQTGVPLKYIIGILVGAFFLVIGGILDDKYNLKPGKQIIFPILAILSVIASGIAPHNISNPFYYLKLSSDSLIHLEFFKIKILTFQGVPYYLTLISDILTFVWLFLLIYTTKFLDGLDGLVSGLSIIAGSFLFIISLSFNQPLIALFCLALSASYLGFLPFNFNFRQKKTFLPLTKGEVGGGNDLNKINLTSPFPPLHNGRVFSDSLQATKQNRARIFLGESGSTLSGYFLAVLAILGEAKITATLLLLGIPVIDAFWVIYQRLIKEKHSPFLGDRKHLHFRLLTKGLSQRKAVLLLWGLCFIFGILGLFMQGIGQWFSLIVLLIFSAILLWWVCRPPYAA